MHAEIIERVRALPTGPSEHPYWESSSGGGVSMEDKDKKEYEEIISSYYGEDQVTS